MQHCGPGLYRTAAAWNTDVLDRGGPQWTGVAELGLALSALGRGAFDEARDHLAAAAQADPSQQPVTDFAIAMLLAADGTAAGPTLSAIAATATDPALREALPILNAYALYWSGDMRAAGDSFMSFAIANPDSRFADDALYAAAEANLQAGDEGGARRDLEALAGDGHARGRVPTLMLELDPARGGARGNAARPRAAGPVHTASHRRPARRRWRPPRSSGARETGSAVCGILGIAPGGGTSRLRSRRPMRPQARWPPPPQTGHFPPVHRPPREGTTPPCRPPHVTSAFRGRRSPSWSCSRSWARTSSPAARRSARPASSAEGQRRRRFGGSCASRAG